MSILKEFNTTAAVSSLDWIFIRTQRTFSITQAGLGIGETLNIHVQNNTGSEQLYINGEAVQLSSTHMMTTIDGPCKIKLIKGVTATGVRVELL
jgi:hypothetical protein